MTAKISMTQKLPAAAPKFLFDRHFETAVAIEDNLDPKVGEAAAAFQAEMAPLPAPPRFSADEVMQAREAGQSEGKAWAMQCIEATAAESLAAIGESLVGLSAEAGEAERKCRDEALWLAAALVRKLFPSLAEAAGLEEINKVLGECLDRARDEPRLVVRVSDRLLDRVRDEIGPIAQRVGFDGKLVFLAEASLGPSDVRVEWANGGGERNAEKQWQRIDALLNRALPDTGDQKTGDQKTGDRKMGDYQTGTTSALVEEHADER